jgi:hypothetical protein
MLRSLEAQVNQSKRFEAEVLFLCPDEAPPAIAALAATGCEFKYDPDAIDPYGPTVFGWVTGTTELDDSKLPDWLLGIVDPGDVIQWKVFD